MKAVVLIPVLVLGLTWTFQGVPAEEVEGTEAPTNAAAADTAENLANDVCKLGPEVGPCKMDEPRFFYNSTSMTCELFHYGGCKGNRNNFETKKECMEICSLEEMCNAPPAAGSGNTMCMGLFPSFFYNSTSKSCEGFNYGGCGGNQNRYETEKACLEGCDPNEFCKAAPVTGPCKAAFPRYFYNATTKSCEIFTYGGCGGNQNNFKTEESCLEKCHHED